MRSVSLAALLSAAVLAPTIGFAQIVVQEGERGSVGRAVTGAVAAPIVISTDVIGAVAKLSGPSVRVEERIVIGEPLPARVRVLPVPTHRNYAFAVVNDQRVIVEANSRRVVHIIKTQ